MKVVVDTSALIYLNDFRGFDEILTVPEVIEESKDRITAIKLSTVNPKTFEPSELALEEIKAVAKVTGDLEKLSKTDLKIIALAKERNATILSDDYSVQNVAERMKIPYMSIFSKEITKLITWKKYCSACKKHYNSGSTCKMCGGNLKRVPVESAKVTKSWA
jgi:UPF0271 protein